MRTHYFHLGFDPEFYSLWGRTLDYLESNAMALTVEQVNTKLDKILAEIQAAKASDAAVVADRDAQIAALKVERDELKAQIALGGLSAAEEDAAFSRLDEIDAAFADLPTPTPTPTPPDGGTPPVDGGIPPAPAPEPAPAPAPEPAPAPAPAPEPAPPL